LRLTDAEQCRRKLKIDSLWTKGLTFQGVEGELGESLVDHFFSQGQINDPNLYKRLADNYTAHGLHYQADEALIHQAPLLGWARKLGGSLWWRLSLVIGLWLAPVPFWSAWSWPLKAGLIDRIVLAADLLLPDLVGLGARERYDSELKK